MSRNTLRICLLAALVAGLGTVFALTWDPGSAPPSGDTALDGPGSGQSVRSDSTQVQRAAADSSNREPDDEVVISGSVENAAGEPVSGARIELRHRDVPSPEAGAEDAISLVADKNGAFAFAVDAPGAYRLVASHGDATRALVVIAPVADVRIVLNDAAPPSLDGALTVHVLDEESRRPVEGVDVVVRAGAVGDAELASGRTDAEGTCQLDVGEAADIRVVAALADGRRGMAAMSRDPRSAPFPDAVVRIGASGSITGNVMAPTGVPEDLRVFAQPEPTALGVRYEGRVMRSSSGVRYLIEGLPAGAYSVAIRSEQNVRMLRTNNSGALLRDPSHRGWMRRLVGLVRNGTATELDIELAAAASVEGRVLDGRGSPLAGAEVSVVRVLGERRPEESWVDDRPVDLEVRAEVVDRDFSALLRTGPRGSYSLHGLQPGSYRVAAFADDRTPDVRFDVTLVAGEKVSLEHRLAASGSLRGAVRGRPLLRVTAADGTQLLTRADVHGAFAMDRVPAGTASLAAVDYAAARRANRTGDTTAWRVLGEVEIIAGRSTWTDLRDRCEVTLHGVVLSGQLPVAGATVQVAGVAARSGADGKFTIRMAAPPASWDAWVWWNGFRWRSRAVVQELGTDQWAGEVALGAFGLDVQAVDGAGRPVPATVKLRSSDGGFVGTLAIDASGRGSAAHVVPGKLAVEATFDNGATVARRLKVPADNAVTLTRPDVATLGIAVTDPDGRPQHRVAVLVSAWTGQGPAPDPFPTQGDGVRTLKQLTDFRGTARFRSVPAGEVLVQLRVTPGVTPPKPLRLSLARGENKSLSVEVAASAR